MARTRCPEATYGWHEPGQDGRCLWCKQQVSSRWSRPLPPRGARSELELAYNYHYNPDFGKDDSDSY